MADKPVIRRHKVPIADAVRQGQKVVTIEDGATRGAVVGVNVYLENGELYVPATAGSGSGQATEVYWRIIREIPTNIVRLAELTGAGLIRRNADGTFTLVQEGYPPQLGHARI